jgi:hypothetical protein
MNRGDYDPEILTLDDLQESASKKLDKATTGEQSCSELIFLELFQFKLALLEQISIMAVPWISSRQSQLEVALPRLADISDFSSAAFAPMSRASNAIASVHVFWSTFPRSTCPRRCAGSR